MTIQFVGNFTEAMKNYTKEKLSKIESKGIDCENVRVKLDILPVDMVLEVSINNRIRNSKKGQDFYALVVDIVDSICSQSGRYKKYYNRKDNQELEAFSPLSHEISEVVRSKMLFLENMSQDDAIDMMELLGHSFFIYKDIDQQNDVCVLYKRKDNSYGLIHCK